LKRFTRYVVRFAATPNEAAFSNVSLAAHIKRERERERERAIQYIPFLNRSVQTIVQLHSANFVPTVCGIHQVGR
jgi:hypothetical protein